MRSGLLHSKWYLWEHNIEFVKYSETYANQGWWYSILDTVYIVIDVMWFEYVYSAREIGHFHILTLMAGRRLPTGEWKSSDEILIHKEEQDSWCAGSKRE